MGNFKFWIGVTLLLGNFVIGKIATVLFFIYYDQTLWRWFSIGLYLFSWLMLFAGLLLFGKEGWDLMVKVYVDYQNKTVRNIKDHGQKTYSKVKDRVRRQISKTRKL